MKKLIQSVLALLAMTLFAGLLASSYPQAAAPASQLTATTQPQLWVLSDTHFIAPSLHDEKKAYQLIKGSDAGKDMDYQPVAINALVQTALKKRPTAVIITGDVTFNGAKASAESLAKRLAPLEKAGIHVLVIPGNHDIYDGWARAYKGDEQQVVDQISPSDWKNIWWGSYQAASSVDSQSLSYTVTLNRNYELIMLDSNIYTVQPATRPPSTGGLLKPETLTWLTAQLKAARKNGRTPLVFMHHNLYAHSAVVSTGYVLSNADTLQKLLTKYKVQVLFSGHIHAQDIENDPAGKCLTTEIVDGAFSISPAGYGIVDLTPTTLHYQRQALDISPYLTAKQKKNPDLRDYPAYLKKLFMRNGQALAINTMMDGSDTFSDKEVTIGANFIGELNWRYFTGQDDPTPKELATLKASKGYQIVKRSPSLMRYVNSILQDKNLNDQTLTIHFN
ncbi:metallophosphoesterase [Lacticaseibacillus mingshuiensis]|uniref:metallophosphoesterase n=1 Tax=Lacticaseibacillus mingshuiensis TaxID=2799574 RepID=UPI001950A8C4|nr:metallophosphoesterase [Lacticaseibacillus mingshuiensis]